MSGNYKRKGPTVAGIRNLIRNELPDLIEIDLEHGKYMRPEDLRFALKNSEENLSRISLFINHLCEYCNMSIGNMFNRVVIKSHSRSKTRRMNKKKDNDRAERAVSTKATNNENTDYIKCSECPFSSTEDGFLSVDGNLVCPSCGSEIQQ